MRSVSTCGAAAGLWVALVALAPAAFGQDSTAAVPAEAPVAAPEARTLSGQYLTASGEASTTLLRGFDTTDLGSQDESHALAGSALYAIASVPDLGSSWALEGASSSNNPTARSSKHLFLKSWAMVTSVEVVLLATTAMLPSDLTGWHGDIIQDGLHHLGRAYTTPPAMDHDTWYTNYAGHPYGGSVYYNTLRSQGASKTESFVFTALLSTQWEYVFEAVAERPSIQDLIVTPISGRIFGELINRMTLGMVKGGTTVLEKVAITILNPMYVLNRGY